MANLTPPLRLLVALADAFETRDASGAREPIYVLHHSGGLELQHFALEADAYPGFDDEMLDRLEGQGVIRIDYAGQHTRKIYVTEAGENVAADARRILDGDDDEDDAAPVDLDWDTVARPTLQTVYRLWVERGAPERGILTSKVIDEIGEEHETQTHRVISALIEDGHLASASVLGTEHGPVAMTVTARGLQVVAGWPSTTPEAAASALVAALEKAIQETDSPERRTKLERLKEAVVDVGQGTMVEVFKHLIVGGAL